MTVSFVFSGALVAALVLTPHVLSYPMLKSLNSTVDGPVVKTSYGHVMGTYSKDPGRSNIAAFLGMRYAAPPVGEARWKAPTKPQAWDGIYNATAFGSQCPQNLDDGRGLWTTGSEVMSEDCLFVNVWTKASNLESTEKLPVYVWMHGGRFEDGSGDVETYDGAGLAAEGIVMVTINFRLGPFGYFAHPDLSAESGHNSSGNYGVLDMIASVDWVRSEISYFGGDPEKITVGGQSSGSSCALDMMYSPLSQGMIAGVIAESGARAPDDPLTGSLATSYRQKDAAEAQGVNFVAECNVTTIAEMRNLTMEFLLQFDTLNDTIFDNTNYENVSNFMEAPMFRPNLDGYVLQYSYGDNLLYNGHGDVAVLTGNNLDESGAATSPGFTVDWYKGNFTEMLSNTNLTAKFSELWPASTDTEADNQNNDFWQTVSRVSTWIWGQHWYAGLEADKSLQAYASEKSILGDNIYTYFWTHSPPGQDLGAFHGSEMYYVFNDIPYNYPDMPWHATDYAIQRTMVQYWVNFIKAGNPNGGNLTYWPPTGDAETTMWLGDSWGPQEIGTPEKKQFVEDWFAQANSLW